jgi:hypothetical protein
LLPGAVSGRREEPSMSEQSPRQERSAGAPEGAVRRRTGPARPVPRRRGARRASLGAAVVIVGGGVAAVAVAAHHHGQGTASGPERAGADGGERGGTAWLAGVAGPDGVRHDVILPGSDGAATGTTVAARAAATTGGGLPG